MEGNTNVIRLFFRLGAASFVIVFSAHAEDTNSSPARRFVLNAHLGPALQQDISVKSGFLFDPSRNGNIKFLTGGRFDVGIGYKIIDSLAVGVESGLVITWPRSDQAGDFDFAQVPIMATVNYSIPVSWPVKPYVGLGVGGVLTYVQQSRFSGPTFADRDFSPAGEVFAGLRYEFNDRFDISLEYKFVATGDINFDQQHATLSGTGTHSLAAGFGFRF